jgi:hypothetical protein
VVAQVGGRIEDLTIWRNPNRTSALAGLGDARVESFGGVAPSHWWLVATVR